MTVRLPALYSLLLGTRDAQRLRDWYADMLGVTGDVDGFLHFGPVAVLIDQRDDLELRTAEPGRVVLNYTVTDIKAWVERLSARGASWVAELEYRDAGGAWFATTADPDGNHVQLIELTPDYWRQRRERQQGSPLARAALRDAHVAPRLPAQDLERARRFYSERLGLEPAESRPGAYRYELDGTDFAIFASTGAASGTHTQLGFYVADLDSTVAELRSSSMTARAICSASVSWFTDPWL